MESRYTKKFRLLKVVTKRWDDVFEVRFEDVTEGGYGRLSAAREEFDSEEEAIEHALTSKEWEHVAFTVVPVYTKNYNY